MQSGADRLPKSFEQFTTELLSEIENVEGYLAPNEIRFLALMAACPTAEGEILEIGSFKGKSTIVLAKSAALANEKAFVNAVDPMTAPSETDPDLAGADSSLEDFRRNLSQHGVDGRVRFHQKFSHELSPDWKTPLRLLWIDGDHTYEGTKLDFDGFAPWLADGAIVAIHDVLHEFEGGARVVAEKILASPHFGPCGFCGSIAWAQFHSSVEDAAPYRADRETLLRKVRRIVPLLSRGGLKGLEKKKYKFYRWLIPHGPVDPHEWLRSVT